MIYISFPFVRLGNMSIDCCSVKYLNNVPVSEISPICFPMIELANLRSSLFSDEDSVKEGGVDSIVAFSNNLSFSILFKSKLFVVHFMSLIKLTNNKDFTVNIHFDYDFTNFILFSLGNLTNRFNLF